MFKASAQLSAEQAKRDAVLAFRQEIGVLIVGCVVSFLVSLLVIRGLMEYVRKHSFSAFGVYRIVLGILVLAYFAIAK